MMHLALLFAAGLLAFARAASMRHSRLLPTIDNHIETHSSPTKHPRKFVALTNQLPAVTVQKAGSTVELTCEGIGAPAPTIRWFRNAAPVFEHNLESNEIIETNPTSLARIASTLLVPQGSAHDKYTCVISTGYKTTGSTTTIVSEDGSTVQDDRMKLYPLEPRILVYYKILVDNIGNNIVIPCKARGHPRPQISWTDNKGTSIKNNPRMKVLRTGELMISSLRWSDMGGFTCTAQNAHGSNSTMTFVYPAKAG